MLKVKKKIFIWLNNCIMKTYYYIMSMILGILNRTFTAPLQKVIS